jgi:hypothetical protein
VKIATRATPLYHATPGRIGRLAHLATLAGLATVLGFFAAMSATAADLHDPMRPPGAPAAAISRTHAPASLQLHAVMGPSNARVAIVDGKAVRVGDTFNGARITEIAADRIVYTRGGKQLVAALPNPKLNVRTNTTLQAGQP